jgi:hypothetical protein
LIVGLPTRTSASTIASTMSEKNRCPVLITENAFNTPNVLEHSLENRETVECISQLAMLLGVCNRQSP